MRLAKLKTKASNPLYVHPDKIISIYIDSTRITIIVYSSDQHVKITMTLEEVVKEINDALNHDPSVERKIKHLEKRFKRDIDQVKSMTQGSCLGPNR